MRVVIVGGGYVGMYTALRLQRRLRRDEAMITVIDPAPGMVYQPFLPEVAAGSIEPRHVMVSRRRVLRHCRVVTARVVAIDHRRRTVSVVVTGDGTSCDIGYDVVVIGLGSITKALPVPGLAEVAFEFKHVDDAIGLRNHVLGRLDVANATVDDTARRRALTFVVVGGGYAGIEVLGALHEMARDACADRRIDPATMRWLLVEASDRVLPEVSRELCAYAIRQLRRRGIEVLLRTRLDSAAGGNLILSDGRVVATDTVVCTAGVRANPVLFHSDLPLDDTGRVITSATLAVAGTTDAWAAGDSAAVPDLTTPDTLCSPSAQHAIRQAKVLADNIVRTHRNRPAKPYRHRHAGSVASLGRHQGAAEIYGVRIRGLTAWLVHRTYHLCLMPTLDRRARILVDWALAALFRRDELAVGARTVSAPTPSTETSPADVAGGGDEPHPSAALDLVVGDGSHGR